MFSFFGAGMKKLIGVFCLLISTCSIAHASDGPFVDQDSINRFTAEAAIGTVAGLTIDNKQVAWAAAMAPTVAYEFYKTKRDPEYKLNVKGLVFSGVGAAVGVKFGHWTIRRNKIIYRTEF